MTSNRESLRLRFATIEEIAVIDRLIARCKNCCDHGKHLTGTLTPELEFDLDHVTGGRALVAVAEGELAGICAWSSTGPDKSALLSHLFVVPEHAGSEVAAALLEAATAQAEWEGAAQFTILADPSSARFYLQQGALAAGRCGSPLDPHGSRPLLVLKLAGRTARFGKIMSLAAGGSRVFGSETSQLSDNLGSNNAESARERRSDL